MSEAEETQVMRPLGAETPINEDVVQMYGERWKVRERCLVRIAALTDSAGRVLDPQNWRSAYVGAYAEATFADEEGSAGRSVAQLRHLIYLEGGSYRATCDMLRTSSGVLSEPYPGRIELATKRTCYVFERVVEPEASRIARVLEIL